jgi:DNA-binding transcriptional MerR regulator
MKIGELARRSGRSIHTLRYYETQKLMPNVARDAGGRRIYGERHLDWLDFLARLRRSGMSVAEMQDYTALVSRGDGTLARRRDFLRMHRDRVQAAVEDLQNSLALLDEKIALYAKWIAKGGSKEADRGGVIPRAVPPGDRLGSPSGLADNRRPARR